MADLLPEADLLDPNPDVQELFWHYDDLYFQGALTAAGFSVRWGSPPNSNTSAFGSCTFSKPRNTITLFEPVLRYRSTADRKKALLHEMIHAIIYVKLERKNRQHGPDFRAWMDAINSCTVNDNQRPQNGYNITTRHDFDPEEPCSITGFQWRCTSCGSTLVRPTNQGPPSDACCIEKVDDYETCGNMLCRWHSHKEECGGTYEKIVCADHNKNPRGTQLFLTYTSGMLDSKEATQEFGPAELQVNTEVTKPNVESQKAGKKHRSEAVWERSVVPVEPLKKMKLKEALVAKQKLELSPGGCNNAKSPVTSISRKAGRLDKPEGVLTDPTESKLKLKQQLVPTEKHMLLSREESDDAKSPGSNISENASEWQKLEIAGTACSPTSYPLRRLRKCSVSAEKNELFPGIACSNKKLQDTTKKRKQLEPVGIQKTTVLPAARGSKPNEPSFVAYEEKQKRKHKSKQGKPARKKEYAVMSAYLDYYESDRSSGSTEPLVNKRTERRKIERERERAIARLKSYSRSKKASAAPLDQAMAQASLHHQFQPSYTCFDIVPLDPAASPGSVPPGQSAGLDIIEISDDE